MIRRPPRPPPFPYTTLFRSQRPGRRPPGEAALLLRAQPRPDRLAVHARPAPAAPVIAAAERDEVGEVATVRLHGVRGIVALFREELDEGRHFGDGAQARTGTARRAAKASMSASEI